MANTEKETLAREYYSLNQQHKDAIAKFEGAKRSVWNAKVCPRYAEGKVVTNELSQDLEKRLLAEAQAAHQVVTRLEAELQEEQPLNIATFQENLDVSVFRPLHFDVYRYLSGCSKRTQRLARSTHRCSGSTPEIKGAGRSVGEDTRHCATKD